MAVKEKNIFGGGSNYMNDIKHDVLTGRMFTQDVIVNTIKPLRAEMGIENNATAKDEVSFTLRKKLAEMGVQQIESVYGHFSGIKVRVEPAGKGIAREAKLSLVDTETGAVDHVVLNLSSPSGQMTIQKLKQVKPGELIDLRMFTVVSDTNADGTPKIDKVTGVQTSYVNHIGAITRENGEKITLNGDKEVEALRELVTTKMAEHTDPVMKNAIKSSLLAEASVACAKEIAKHMDGYKFDTKGFAGHQHAADPASKNEAADDHGDVFNSDDVSFGEDEGFAPGKTKPRA